MTNKPMTDNEIFVQLWNTIAVDVAETARSKGWTIGNDGEAIALMHSELSEALEYIRHGNPSDDKIPAFSGVEAELADVVIRIMHFATLRKYDVASAVLAKAEMNKHRAFKHGGKAF